MTKPTTYDFKVATNSQIDLKRILKENSDSKIVVVDRQNLSSLRGVYVKESFLRKLQSSGLIIGSHTKSPTL